MPLAQSYKGKVMAAQRAKKSIVRHKAVINRVAPKAKQASIASEWKFVDTALSLANVSTTATVTLLNGLAQGTSASTRIGRKVEFRTMEMKGFTNAQSTTNVSVGKYAIVLDKQSNGAAPAFTDIYDSATPISLRNISNKERFVVLWDSGLVNIIGPVTGVIATQQLTEASQQVHEMYKKYSFQTQYNSGTTGTVTDISTNALYFVAVGDDPTGTLSMTFNGNLRLRYTD